MTSNGQFLGEVKSIQKEKESKEFVNQNEEVAIAMDNVEFGHEIQEESLLYSYFDRNSLLLCAENKHLLSNEQLSILKEIASNLGLSHLLK
ncbi:MAG: hypothetical protein QXF76_02200 [Candidatus Anstonellales archaeon]